MAIVPQKLSSICRFCLCGDREKLLIIANTLNSTLTIEDVRRFTGIPVQPNDTLDSAICFECLSSLKSSTDFRYACIRNDDAYRQLCFGPATSAKEAEQCMPDLYELDADPLEFKCDTIELVKAEPIDYIDTGDHDYLGPVIAVQEIEKEEYEAPYSANYIEPGESVSDDDEDPGELYMRKETSRPRKVDTKVKSSTRPPAVRCATQTETVSTKRKKKQYPKKRVLCHMCGKLRLRLEAHIAMHLNLVNYACPHCPVRMRHETNLQRHIEQVHEQKIVRTCELCGKGFKHVNTYKSHQRIEHNIGETSFNCKVCFKKYRHPCGLRNHMAAMHGDKTHSCTTCGMEFKLKQRLKEHQRVHSDERPFSCKHCPKRFKYAHAKAIHELTHSGIVFDCKHCGKSFRYKAQYMTHLRKTHPDCVELAAGGSSHEPVSD